MRKSHLIAAGVAALLLVEAPAVAGKIISGGNESFVPVSPDGGTAEVLVSGGTSPLPVYSPVCANATQGLAAVGTTAVAVPTSALPGRKSLRVCVSLENAGSPKVKCALGSVPVMGFAATDAGTPIGDVLAPGDCFTYSVDTSTLVRCVSDTAGTGVITFECS